MDDRETRQQEVRDRDSVQDVEVRALRAGALQRAQESYSVRSSNIRGLIFHNSHLRDGRGTQRNCSYCREGLASFSKAVEKEETEPGVVESDGADKKETDSSPPDSWWTR